MNLGGFVTLLLMTGINAGSLRTTKIQNKAKFANIQEIIFYKDVPTITRKIHSEPIPQLICSGGSAGCDGWTPSSVLCRNIGTYDYKPQWDCKSDNMPSNYKFGNVRVSCEGFDGPDDQNVLIGSCNLTYDLNLTHSKATFMENLVFLIIVLLISYILTAIGFACTSLLFGTNDDDYNGFWEGFFLPFLIFPAWCARDPPPPPPGGGGGGASGSGYGEVRRDR